MSPTCGKMCAMPSAPNTAMHGAPLADLKLHRRRSAAATQHAAVVGGVAVALGGGCLEALPRLVREVGPGRGGVGASRIGESSAGQRLREGRGGVARSEHSTEPDRAARSTATSSHAPACLRTRRHAGPRPAAAQRPLLQRRPALARFAALRPGRTWAAMCVDMRRRAANFGRRQGRSLCARSTPKLQRAATWPASAALRKYTAASRRSLCARGRSEPGLPPDTAQPMSATSPRVRSPKTKVEHTELMADTFLAARRPPAHVQQQVSSGKKPDGQEPHPIDSASWRSARYCYRLTTCSNRARKST